MISVKTEEEISLMREPCRIVKETLEYVGKHICAGMTTKQVDELVYKYITANGAIPSSLGYYGHPASACLSVNEVVVHGLPGDRVIEEGDIASVDITAEKHVLNGAAQRTVMIGKVSEEKRKPVEVKA